MDKRIRREIIGGLVRLPDGKLGRVIAINTEGTARVIPYKESGVHQDISQDVLVSVKEN